MRRILLTLAVSLGLSPYAMTDLWAADAPSAKADAKPAAPLIMQEYALVKEKSSVKFYAIANGAPVEGKFADFSTDVKFDPNHLDQSSISATVQTGSVESDNADAQNNLKLPEWLSVAAFPAATFKSTKISHMPMSDGYYAAGTLTLKGKTQPATLNFELKNYGSTDIAEGYLTVKRIAFGVGQGQWAKDDAVKDEVRVEFRIVEEKK